MINIFLKKLIILAVAPKKIKQNLNKDTHNPHEFEAKWYSIWQKKLNEFNAQVIIIIKKFQNRIKFK